MTAENQQESRVKKTLLNARVNLVFYFLTLILSFFSRKIFLNSLGADFVGLTGTLQNLLGFLNLAELGISSAIGYVLYKPIFDRDQTKITEIISVMGYLYRWIGLIILGLGIILSFFLPLIFPDSGTGFHLPLIYFAYYSFLASSLIGYFINYRQNLLGADQRNYVVTGYFQSMNILKTVIQMALAYYTGSYYLWIAIELIFGIGYSFILNWKINQVYPWLHAEISLGKKVFKKYPEVMTKTKQLFVHRISEFVQFQTTPFLVYSFVSLTTVAYYMNYTIVVDKLYQLMLNFLGGMNASIGNLIAEGNRNKVIAVFWELFAFRMILFSTIVVALYYLMSPFICLWLGSEYLLPESILIVILVNIFIGQYRAGTGQFLFGFGLVNDVWAPIAEATIFITVAIAAGYKLGLIGILLATTISTFFIIALWKPYFLFKKGFNLSYWNYWKNNGLYLGLTVLAFFISKYIFSATHLSENINSWQKWVLSGISITLIFGIIEFLLLYLFTFGGKRLVQRFILKRSI